MFYIVSNGGIQFDCFSLNLVLLDILFLYVYVCVFSVLPRFFFVLVFNFCFLLISHKL